MFSKKLHSRLDTERRPRQSGKPRSRAGSVPAFL